MRPAWSKRSAICSETRRMPTSTRHKGMAMRGRVKKKSSVEAPPFERVQALVRRIPRGKVATYGQLSRMIDGRLTPVGVGWAIRAAPEGSIPWQRVVNAKGG